MLLLWFNFLKPRCRIPDLDATIKGIGRGRGVVQYIYQLFDILKIIFYADLNIQFRNGADAEKLFLYLRLSPLLLSRLLERPIEKVRK